MADDDKADTKAGAPAKRTPGDRGAGAAEEAPAQRPELGPRALTRNERETLRTRLQKKFH